MARKMGKRLLIELHVSGIEAALARREVDLENEATRLLSRGVRRQAAEAILAGRVDDLVRLVSQDLAREILAGVNEMSAASYFDQVVQTGDYFRWEFEPTVKIHCPDCEKRNTQVGTAEEMQEVGLPGSGATECSIGCRCRIVPITREEYDEGEKISG